MFKFILIHHYYLENGERVSEMHGPVDENASIRLMMNMLNFVLVGGRSGGFNHDRKASIEIRRID